jgi:phytoene dehydrogenase-like protein
VDTPPIVIGAGHNGLVAAYHLAKAGLRPIVLERAAEIGGGAITSELHPGFRVPTFTHELLVHEDIVRSMDLERHGVRFIDVPVDVCALSLEGPPLALYSDTVRTVDELRSAGIADADAYTSWRAAVDAITSVLAPLLAAPPPTIDTFELRDLSNLIGLGRRFRALPKREGYRLLRWLPMAVADLVRESFSHDLLCATLAGPGVSGTPLGPRSAGSGLVLLLREAHRRLAGGRSRRVVGGPGALTQAMAAAARAAGAEIRVNAPVTQIPVRDGRVIGVIVEGHWIGAEVVLSSADPRQTFLSLIDPVELLPAFRSKLRNYRSRGTLAKVNLALSALPAFTGIGGRTELLTGRLHIGPTIDYLERAFDHSKYGEISAAPWLEVSMPSLLDPSLTPPGGHVASIYVHYAPYHLRDRDWNEARDALLAATMTVLERYAPGIRSLVVAAEVVTPVDLEQRLGLSGGNIFHGELAADQLLGFRPSIGYGQYAGPIGGLYLCGGGTHPGGFMTGASGRLAAGEVLKNIAAP